MQTDVFETIRFHARQRRRRVPPVPIRLVVGGAVLALLLAYAGTLHAAEGPQGSTSFSSHKGLARTK